MNTKVGYRKTNFPASVDEVDVDKFMVSVIVVQEDNGWPISYSDLSGLFDKFAKRKVVFKEHFDTMYDLAKYLHDRLLSEFNCCGFGKIIGLSVRVVPNKWNSFYVEVRSGVMEEK